jgi:hypothetical protein
VERWSTLKNFKNSKWREEVSDIAGTILERQIRFARLQFIDIKCECEFIELARMVEYVPLPVMWR